MSDVGVADFGDLPGLLAIDPMARTDDSRRRAVSVALEAGRCFVVREAGAIRGFALVHTHFFGEAFLDLLFIAEGQRRRGFGRHLLRHIVAVYPGQKVFTSTNSSNLPMQALLTGEGFVSSGVIENLDPGDPEWVYCHLPEGAGGP